jgi:hypothetical protein
MAAQHPTAIEEMKRAGIGLGIRVTGLDTQEKGKV